MALSSHVVAYYYIAHVEGEVEAYYEPNGKFAGMLPSGIHIATEFAYPWTRVSLESNIYATGGYWVKSDALSGVYFTPYGDVCEQVYGDDDYNNPVCITVTDQSLKCKEVDGYFSDCNVMVEYQLEAGELKGRNYVDAIFKCDVLIAYKNFGDNIPSTGGKRTFTITFEENRQLDTKSATRFESVQNYRFVRALMDQVHWVNIVDVDCKFMDVRSY